MSPLNSMVATTYPDLTEKLFDSEYLTSRAILAPTMEVVDQTRLLNIIAQIQFARLIQEKRPLKIFMTWNSLTQ